MCETFTYKYKETIFSITDNIPISANEIPDFNDMLFHCFTNIKNTTEIRVIILETWMVLEYYIRSGLSYAFNLSQYQTDDLDPKYELLPNSFSVCLDKLKLLIDTQRKLPPAPPEKDDIKAPFGLLHYMKIEYPDFYEKLGSIIEEYNKIKHPECFPEIDYSLIAVTSSYYGPFQKRKIVSVFENITDSWYRKALKLNKARNIAAHSYNSEKIYTSLGINGSNKFENTRKYCPNFLNELCSYKVCAPDTPIDIDMDI